MCALGRASAHGSSCARTRNIRLQCAAALLRLIQRRAHCVRLAASQHRNPLLQQLCPPNRDVSGVRARQKNSACQFLPRFPRVPPPMTRSTPPVASEPRQSCNLSSSPRRSTRTAVYCSARTHATYTCTHAHTTHTTHKQHAHTQACAHTQTDPEMHLQTTNPHAINQYHTCRRSTASASRSPADAAV